MLGKKAQKSNIRRAAPNSNQVVDSILSHLRHQRLTPEEKINSRMVKPKLPWKPFKISVLFIVRLYMMKYVEDFQIP